MILLSSVGLVVYAVNWIMKKVRSGEAEVAGQGQGLRSDHEKSD